jgi:hypothetical protein
VVKALCYRPESRGFEARLRDFFFFNLHNDSGRTNPCRSEYQKQKNMFLGSKVLSERRVDNLTAIYEPVVYTMGDV